MHHGTYVTHEPWCMPGSLTSGFLWSWWQGKRSRHSGCMRNPQLYVSGKRPIAYNKAQHNKIALIYLKDTPHLLYWSLVICPTSLLVFLSSFTLEKPNITRSLWCKHTSMVSVYWCRNGCWDLASKTPDCLNNKSCIKPPGDFTYILMSHNMIHYFHLPYFHVSNSALFFL